MKKAFAYLIGGAVVALAIIVGQSSSPEAPGLLEIKSAAGVATMTLQTDGVFEISGSHDGQSWTPIETQWNTATYGRTMLIDHQMQGFAYFKAKPL